MFIQAEVIVLLWFLPVALNIILPLGVGSIILLKKLLQPHTQPLTRAETTLAKGSEKRMQDLPPRVMPV
jgi:hypothetical protein